MIDKVKKIPEDYILNIIAAAVKEDAPQGDITSEVLIPADLKGTARMIAKQEGIIAGAGIAAAVFKYVDNETDIVVMIDDGAAVKKGEVIMQITGGMRSILKAERAALNFIQRMSGIASTTARYVEKVSGTGMDIADTRKTTPGLRLLEKYAVAVGGGRNHRLSLSDAVLIKDNHFDSLKIAGISYKQVVVKARKEAPENMIVEAEARSIIEAVEAAEAGADIVMLDNMSFEDMREAVRLIKGKAEIEASGGITLANIREIAETGVDFVSVGALTHSYNSLDISLLIKPQQ
jgi:nicotinate-nucleotide pyrophosphorylase (carboxylating)